MQSSTITATIASSNTTTSPSVETPPTWFPVHSKAPVLYYAFCIGRRWRLVCILACFLFYQNAMTMLMTESFLYWHNTRVA